jgi:hypothetical protein
LKLEKLNSKSGAKNAPKEKTQAPKKSKVKSFFFSRKKTKKDEHQVSSSESDSEKEKDSFNGNEVIAASELPKYFISLSYFTFCFQIH